MQISTVASINCNTANNHNFCEAKLTSMTVRPRHRPKSQHIQNLYRGCLVGGAVGDALGAPVEFLSGTQILEVFGPSGIQEYAHSFGKLGAITDDTQMTLFTAEGLIRGWVRGSLRGVCHIPSVIALAYHRWLHTSGQSHPLHQGCLDGWLSGHPGLFARRAPGPTCLSGLQDMTRSGDVATSDSNGRCFFQNAT